MQHEPEQHIHIHTEASNGLGVAGFVTSLVGAITCGCLSPVGLLLSVIALYWKPRGLAAAGVILGIVGSWWLYAFGLMMVLGYAGLSNAVREAEERAALTPQTAPPRDLSEEFEFSDPVTAQPVEMPTIIGPNTPVEYEPNWKPSDPADQTPATPIAPQSPPGVVIPEPPAKYVVTLVSGKEIRVLGYTEGTDAYKLTTMNGGSISYPKALVKEIKSAE